MWLPPNVEDKPLISFGSDESIHKRFLISLNTWTRPGGERNTAPKDDGLGIMISDFQSWEFGFAVVVSKSYIFCQTTSQKVGY
jgi:hypothetical protein